MANKDRDLNEILLEQLEESRASKKKKKNPQCDEYGNIREKSNSTPVKDFCKWAAKVGVMAYVGYQFGKRIGR